MSENSDKKKQRPIHVAFLRYTDKVKILSNAAARIKDNPFQGNLIGIGADFAKRTQERRKELVPYKKTYTEEDGAGKKGFHCLPRHPEVPGREWPGEYSTERRIQEDEKRNEKKKEVKGAFD